MPEDLQSKTNTQGKLFLKAIQRTESNLVDVFYIVCYFPSYWCHDEINTAKYLQAKQEHVIIMCSNFGRS